MSRRSWPGDDADRPLADRGRRQAEALAAGPTPLAIGLVLSSPAVRCVATVAPLAAARGLEVEPEGDLFEGRGGRAAALVRSLLEPGSEVAGSAGRVVVLCSHGDVIPEVLVELEREGADLGDDARCQKGSTWALERRADGAVSGRYLPPPA